MEHETHNTEHVTRNMKHEGRSTKSKLPRATSYVSHGADYVSREGGYVAIIAAMIICAAIVLIVTTISQSSFLNRAGIAAAHYKERSRSLAQACANTALLKLVSNPSYAGGETIAVSSDICSIVSVVSTSTGRVISAQGIFERSYTNYKVTVASATVSIINWEEVKSF